MTLHQPFKPLNFCLAVTLASALTACGGGGGGGGANTSTGVFLDAEVAGVSYESLPSGRNGVTNAAGEYQYVAGDTVTFSVGGIVLGSAPATGVMTPTTLASAIDPMTLPGGVTAADVATNIAIFLQSFDSDGNPDNGISIAAETVVAANDLVLDFAQTSVDFSADTTLTTLAADQGVTLVSPEDATEHLAESVAKVLEGSWLVDSDSEPGSSLAILSFFPDGTYVLGINHDDVNCADGVEYGSYSVDATAMRLYVSEVTVDNTGNPEIDVQDCGLYEIEDDSSVTIRDSGVPIVINSATQFSLMDSDDVAAGNEENGSYIILNKIERSGVRGAWAEWTDTGVRAVPVLLADGTYMVAQVQEAVEPLGVEVGSYSIGTDNLLTVTEVLVDTNGDAGINGFLDCTLDCPEISVDSFGRLALDIPGEGVVNMASQPYRLNLAGNSASSRGALVWSLCPDDPAGWDYSFVADNMIWTGSDSWDGTPSCGVGQDEVIDFKAALSQEGGVPGVDSAIDTGYYGSDFDAPFSGCLGGVCSYQELNKVLVGEDQSARPFESVYSHIPASDVIEYVKSITGGEDSGQTTSETITLGQ